MLKATWIHSILLYGGVYLCKVCGATAPHKLTSLSKPCCRPSQHGKLNVKAYQKGTKPRGFPNWLHKKVNLMETSSWKYKHKINNMQNTYLHQSKYPESEQDGIDIDEQVASNDGASETGSDSHVCSSCLCLFLRPSPAALRL